MKWNRINILPPERPNRLISVDVLLAWEDGSMRVGYYDFTRLKYFDTECGTEWYIKPIAWMMLPEPPKEEVG